MAYTTINKSSEHFNTKLYTGNGTTDTAITGVGFQPDFNWTKQRSSNEWHTITDSVRGVTKQLFTNSSQADQTNSEFIKSLDSDGFTVGTANATNQNTETFVSWNWLGANGTASNTDGSITSTVSANTTSGFSIVKWTGTGSAGTIGHGLSAEPQVIIVKKLNSSESWFSYHKPLGNTGRLVLNATDGVATDAGYWNSTTPTNQVFYVTSNGSNNASNDIYIAYCFANIVGYSKFGSYVGNGNADGTFIYTGFKPAFIMVKSTGTEGWYLYDTKRTSSNGGNSVDKYLVANDPIAEGTFGAWDYLSNGFKARQNWSGNNTSGQEYIYMAFAEAPLVGTNGVTAKAR